MNILDSNINLIQHVFVKIVASIDFRQVALKILSTV